jgi:hypothetical protein
MTYLSIFIVSHLISRSSTTRSSHLISDPVVSTPISPPHLQHVHKVRPNLPRHVLGTDGRVQTRRAKDVRQVATLPNGLIVVIKHKHIPLLVFPFPRRSGFIAPLVIARTRNKLGVGSENAGAVVPDFDFDFEEVEAGKIASDQKSRRGRARG